MGNISSRPEEGQPLYLKDQPRFSIASLAVTNARRQVVLSVAPNGFPATRLSAKRDLGNDVPVNYVQDPETQLPSYILRIDHEDELDFHFTFVTRQTQSSNQIQTSSNTANQAAHDVSISGLTFAHASNPKDLDILVTREFHADPNLHKNANVQLIGDYTTNGNSAIQYDWSWKWRPPKASEDRGGGYRSSCSFLEYDSKAHRLNTLAAFSFWVSNNIRTSQTPMQSPGFQLNVPVNRSRLPSSQSMQSAVSDSEGYADIPNPPSPNPFFLRTSI